jgi:hypothetical protein
MAVENSGHGTIWQETGGDFDELCKSVEDVGSYHGTSFCCLFLVIVIIIIIIISSLPSSSSINRERQMFPSATG